MIETEIGISIALITTKHYLFMHANPISGFQILLLSILMVYTNGFSH